MNANEIKNLRNQLGLTQEAFAHKLGVSHFTITRWEKGTHKPIPVFERKLIKLLKNIDKGG